MTIVAGRAKSEGDFVHTPMVPNGPFPFTSTTPKNVYSVAWCFCRRMADRSGNV